MAARFQGLWSKCALFHQLRPEQLEKVGALVRILDLDGGQELFAQGDPCTGFFVVLDGQVRIHKAGDDGRDATLSVVRSGFSFAEAALFSGGVFPASAEALGPTVLAFFPRDPFLRLLKEDQALCFKVMESLASWHHKLTFQVQQLSLQDTGERLWRWIQDQARDGVVRLAVPKKVLAAQLGMAPETLSRQLRSLQQRGLIEAGAREIRILA
ncbi:MAG TPA: Crp/Fnr family transcriptional regulator [Holophagaceae bacterium]|nr:Crp/Fnr family transcriptional regulator [Holophagaceae bacterium]